jgi:hypothetical protein
MVTALAQTPFQPSSGRSTEIGFSSDSVGDRPGILRAAKNGIGSDATAPPKRKKTLPFPEEKQRHGRFLFLDFHPLFFTR